MPVILTLTPNPAIDISTSTRRVEPSRKLRCAAESRDPGGGGINVARVAARLGAEATAIFPAGGFAGDELVRLVRREGLATLVLPAHGETRQDFTVLDETTHEEFRFVLPGARLSAADWMTCLQTLASVERKPDIVCASGSLPPGAPEDFYARVAEIVESWGVPFALDTSGRPLASALKERVSLVKPNLQELRELVDGAIDDETSLIGACRRLMEGGRIDTVALTLGAQGALLVTGDSAWRAPALAVPAVSTVGAGDSFLGAMIWALASGKRIDEALGYGAAAGAAALLRHGTELAQAGDIRRLLPQVRVERADAPLASAHVG